MTTGFAVRTASCLARRLADGRGDVVRHGAGLQDAEGGICLQSVRGQCLGDQLCDSCRSCEHFSIFHLTIKLMKRPGRLSAMVYTSGSSRPFQRIWPSSFPRRFPAQRGSNIVCYYVILLEYNPTQRPPPLTGCSSVHTAAITWKGQKTPPTSSHEEAG